MKLFGRRSFLRALGAAPLAGRAAAEAVTKELGGIGVLGGPAQGPMPAGLGEAIGNTTRGRAYQEAGRGWWSETAKREAMRSILANKDHDAEIRTLLYQSHRRIHHLDPDIGGRMSWSLAAKITYQRQRFVDQEIKGSLQDATPWQAINNWVENKLKGFLIG